METILDRINDEYEGLHPVEYAVPHSAKKLAEIEDVMGHVRKTVRDNARKAQKSFSGKIHESTGKYLKDYPEIRWEFENFIDKNRGLPGNYAMNVGRYVLESLMNGDGKFHNVFGTNYCRGRAYDYERAKIAKRNFGYDYDKKKRLDAQKSLLDAEKYGYAKETSYDGAADGYGSYTIEFNPANMEHRTTMMLHDSMSDNAYPVLLDETETWPGLIPKDYDYNYLESPYKNAMHVLIEGDKKYGGDYNELQFHGPLDLGDVDRIVLPKEYMNDNDPSHPTYRSYTIDDIPEMWKNRADENHFDIVDDNGDILYKWGSR